MFASLSLLRLGALIVIVVLILVLGLECMAKKAGSWRELRRTNYSSSDLSPNFGLTILAGTVIATILINPISGDRSVPWLSIVIIVSGLVIGWFVIRRSR